MDTLKDKQLETMFKELRAPTLPTNFNSMLMVRIEKEALKHRRDINFLSIGATCLIALLLVSGSIYAMSLYSDFNIGKSLASYFTKSENSQLIDTSLFSFYIFIGCCAILLLLGDYTMRKIYQSRHK